ncbi:MAG: hypothetical protein KKB50_17275 [Planctomycetes bacterium]|nr:hypothetical protein [Planctomycetota bacterium]
MSDIHTPLHAAQRPFRRPDAGRRRAGTVVLTGAVLLLALLLGHTAGRRLGASTPGQPPESGAGPAPVDLSIELDHDLDNTIQLTSLLPAARVVATLPEHVGLVSQNIDGANVSLLLQHPSNDADHPTEIHWPPITVTPHSVVRFSIGMPPFAWVPRNADGATFQVGVSVGDEIDVLYSRFIDPVHQMTDRQWHYGEVVLEPYAHQEIELVFRTLPGPAGNHISDYACWRDAHIWAPQPARVTFRGATHDALATIRDNVIRLALLTPAGGDSTDELVLHKHLQAADYPRTLLLAHLLARHGIQNWLPDDLRVTIDEQDAGIYTLQERSPRYLYVDVDNVLRARVDALELVDRWRNAKLYTTFPERIRREIFEINGDARRTILQHPAAPSETPSEIHWPALQIPPRALLEFGIALPPKYWTAGGDGVRFEIEAHSGRGAEVIFSQYIDPKNDPADRKWFDYRLPLQKYAHSDVRFVFKTFPGPNGNHISDYAGWSYPRLIVPSLANLSLNERVPAHITYLGQSGRGHVSRTGENAFDVTLAPGAALANLSDFTLRGAAPAMAEPVLLMSNGVLQGAFELRPHGTAAPPDSPATSASQPLKLAARSDVAKVARCLAVYDLLGNFSFGPRSLALVPNPDTGLLEPLAFARPDPRGTVDLFAHTNAPFYDFLEQREFFVHYLRELEALASLAQVEELCRASPVAQLCPSYRPARDVLSTNCEHIRTLLTGLKSIHAHCDAATADSITMRLGSIRYLPLEVLHLTQGTDIAFVPKREIVLEPKVIHQPVSYHACTFQRQTGFEAKKVRVAQLRLAYRFVGTETVLYENIYPYPYLDEDALADDPTHRPPNLDSHPFFEADPATGELRIRPGTWTIDRHVIIPAGYRVVAGPGTTLDLTAGAVLLSYSPLEFVGSGGDPVVIRSTDASGQGLAVLQARGPSVLRHVVFDQLANPAHGGWELTGAVTFYESPVQLEHCAFRNCRSEDALNIVRCEFSIQGCEFHQAQSDAFDGDFVTGTLCDTSFTDITNDAIDVSGSQLTVRDVSIAGAGDKGLSAGENSNVQASNISITASTLALTSKDHSQLTVTGARIDQARIAFTAFQKKPEFGPATIVARQVTTSGARNLHLIEIGSALWLDERKIAGQQRNVKDELYPP